MSVSFVYSQYSLLFVEVSIRNTAYDLKKWIEIDAV